MKLCFSKNERFNMRFSETYLTTIKIFKMHRLLLLWVIPIGRLVGWLVGQSVGWLVNPLVGWSILWLVGQSSGWLVNPLVGWSILWLVEEGKGARG